jgi:hypothetical protein
MNRSKIAVAISVALLLSACGDSSNSNGGNMGSLSLSITDAPIDNAESVFIKFDSVTLLHSDPDSNVIFDFPAKSIDLLTLQGTASESLITDSDVAADSYTGLKLSLVNEEGVDDTYIELIGDDTKHELKMPSADGLKVNGEIIVPLNGSASFTADFDVRQSIVVRGNNNANIKGNNSNTNVQGYILKPVLRLVNNVSVGSIMGTVNEALLIDTSCSDDVATTGNAVYVYEGTVVPDDYDGGAVEPITSALLTEVGGIYSYEVGFITEGDYTVSFTCNSDKDLLEDIDAVIAVVDDPLTTDVDETVDAVDAQSKNNDLMFIGTQLAKVIANTAFNVKF